MISCFFSAKVDDILDASRRVEHLANTSKTFYGDNSFINVANCQGFSGVLLEEDESFDRMDPSPAPDISSVSAVLLGAFLYFRSPLRNPWSSSLSYSTEMS
ncbi:hypothetical protein RvY_03772 [Ramazzottius varieornatus]|uniref:Uncharacterized protein n=1 Tax=Ramazzottius varieornatus TaxID=947166 RepID=A0A1D1UWC1_RAMVA|nr:hypothetical protein RvY_03772 [Ramazzottius varieornatus]